MLNYIFKEATGSFENKSAQAISDVYQTMIANPGELIF